jgi:hypothetical protein
MQNPLTFGLTKTLQLMSNLHGPWTTIGIGVPYISGLENCVLIIIFFTPSVLTSYLLFRTFLQAVKDELDELEGMYS